YPFGLPVLLAVVVVDAVASHAPQAEGGRRKAEEDGRHFRLPSSVFRLLLAGDVFLALSLLPALAMALYYAVLFHYNPLWGASNMLRLPPPSISVLAAAFGPLLALGLLPLVARRGMSHAARLVPTWALVNGLLLLAPLPQSERLLNGWSVPLAILAAVGLGRMGRPAARRWAVALSLSNV